MRYATGTLAVIGGIAIVAAIGGAIYIATGSYDVAADSGHGIIDKLAEFTRERSVETRAAAIKVPNLDDAAMVKKGAQAYSHLCKGCHLAPGMSPDPTRKGMNPQPPKYTDIAKVPPAEAFWAAKHGIKMTAMPAWDKTQPASEIWNVIAFLQKVPDMSTQQYHELTNGGGSAGS